MGQESGFGTVPLPFKDVWLVYDSLFEIVSLTLTQVYNRNTLYVQFVHSDTHKLPSWVDRATLWQISEAYELSAYGLYDSDKLKRLRAGPIVKDVFDRIQQKIDGHLPEQKFYAYSGHDTNIASFLTGLGIKFPVFPLHSTALMIELHKDPREEVHIVRLFYRNNTKTDDVYELEIPNCEQPCSFDSISQRLRETLIPKDWEAECNLIPNDANAFPYLLCKFFPHRNFCLSHCFQLFFYLFVSRSFWLFQLCVYSFIRFSTLRHSPNINRRMHKFLNKHLNLRWRSNFC